ncbi:mitochondrial carrier domain-containing protein [Spinellus fusiger]|nr:mitochondrial carrier domain-containing protein [Spinellus fusiger]
MTHNAKLKRFIQEHENSKHAVSGALAGLASAFVTCPLDVVKTRLQNQGRVQPGQVAYQGTLGTLSRIWCDEGIRGLYRGLGPTIFGYLPTWAIYFTVYDYCKNTWSNRDGHQEKSWVVHITSAMTAGAASTTLTNPLWVIKTRFMTQTSRTDYQYKNTLDAFVTIARQEGIRGFYKGLGSSLIGISHVAVQFPLYEKLKSILQTDHNSPPGSMTILLSSSFSKMAASMATYPHEVIRTRLQNQAKKPFKYNGIFHALKVIAREEGFRGFYKGMSANLLRTVPSSAITILTYEVIVQKIDEIKHS